MKQGLLIFFLLVSACLQAQKIANLSEKDYGLFNRTFISKLEFYQDTSALLSFHEVAEQEFRDMTLYSSQDFDSRSVYWFRVRLFNPPGN
ncbi:MAG: 7TM-DISM domain-containing protein, partial [Cytophagaceae bacterium]